MINISVPNTYENTNMDLADSLVIPGHKNNVPLRVNPATREPYQNEGGYTGNLSGFEGMAQKAWTHIDNMCNFRICSYIRETSPEPFHAMLMEIEVLVRRDIFTSPMEIFICHVIHPYSTRTTKPGVRHSTFYERT